MILLFLRMFFISLDYKMGPVVIVFTIAITLMIANANGANIDRFATQGGTVALRCDLPISNDPDVEWVDVVYGSERNPERIFNSRNNPDFNIIEAHKNRGNFQVDRNFTLTISNLDMESDVGQFTCRSRTENGLHRRNYYVTVGELPTCYGETDLRLGEEALLSCEMAYSGHNPNLEWLEAGEPVNSMDEYEIRMAKKVIRLTAASRHDGLRFQCRMTIDSTVHKCHLTLNVSYAVHRPEIHPIKESYERDDKITCTAKGNPVPHVTFGPEFPGSERGSGWAALVVREEWVGKQIQVPCTASNWLDGVEYVESQNLSFNVSAPKEHEHNHHHHHQHHHQHSTAPTIHVQEKGRSAQGDYQVEEKKPIAIHEQGSQAKPQSDAKAVRSNNSAGNLVTFSFMAAILSLIARTVV